MNIMRRRKRLTSQAARLSAAILPALLAACWPGCGGDDGSNEQAPAGTLLFYCGAGMRPAAAEAAEAFGRKTGITVQCDYAGSGDLIARIKLRRKGDLYMPGDVWYVDELARQENLVASRRMVTYFVPAIVVRKGNPKNIRSLADLARPGLRIALGDPRACQIGRITRKILAANRIDAAGIDRNTIMSATTVNELCLWIKTRRIDATIAWDAVAAQFADSADVVAVPTEQTIISRVAIGVLTCSANRPLAERFADFLVSPAGQAIFEKHHYRTQPPQ